MKQGNRYGLRNTALRFRRGQRYPHLCRCSSPLYRRLPTFCFLRSTVQARCLQCASIIRPFWTLSMCVEGPIRTGHPTVRAVVHRGTSGVAGSTEGNAQQETLTWDMWWKRNSVVAHKPSVSTALRRPGAPSSRAFFSDLTARKDFTFPAPAAWRDMRSGGAERIVGAQVCSADRGSG